MLDNKWPRVALTLLAMTLASAALNLVPVAASAQGYWPSGSLIKADGPDIWQIRGTERWRVPSMQVLNDCLGGMSHVTTVSEYDYGNFLTNYSRGPDARCIYYADGSHIRSQSSGSVWITGGRQRVYVPDMATLNCLGGGSQSVNDVDFGQLQTTYTEGGNAVCYADNTQLRTPDGTIWLIYHGARWQVPSMEMYGQCTSLKYWQPYRDMVGDEANRMLVTYANAGPAACPHAPHSEAAVNWANSQLGQTRMSDGTVADNHCDHFVALAYGAANSGHNTATEHYNYLNGRGLTHNGDTAVPFGAYAFFRSTVPDGHVMISRGDGTFVSTGTGSGSIIRVAHLADVSNYLGWSWADPSYPGQ